MSHGAPTLAIDRQHPSHQFFKQLGKQLGRPKAIVCISAHWEEQKAAVNTALAPPQIYDFYGFPDEMYQITWTPAGSPDIAARVAEALRAEGIECRGDPKHGLDHGTWVPLHLMYPEADIPVLQLSLIDSFEPRLHFRMGKALTALAKEEDVLVLGSGLITHNLRDWRAFKKREQWAVDFDKWVEEGVTKTGKEREDHFATFKQHPLIHDAHPRVEHFVPLLPLVGVPGTGKAIKLHEHWDGSFSMAAYAFPFVTPEEDSATTSAPADEL